MNFRPRTQEAFLDIAETITRRFARHDDEAQHWPNKQPSRGTAPRSRTHSEAHGRDSISIAAISACNFSPASMPGRLIPNP